MAKLQNQFLKVNMGFKTTNSSKNKLHRSESVNTGPGDRAAKKTLKEGEGKVRATCGWGTIDAEGGCETEYRRWRWIEGEC